MSKGWDDDHLSQLEGHGGDLTSKLSEIIFVASADTLDEAMNPEPFEQTSHLTTVLVAEMLAQALVGEALDDEFAAEQGAKERGVLLSEEMEALVATLIHGLGFSYLV